MTVHRKSESAFEVNRAIVAKAVRSVLRGAARYGSLVEHKENCLFTTYVKPYWWALGTRMSISLEDTESGTRVTVQTKSQIFILGDIFNAYNHWIQAFLNDLRIAIQHMDHSLSEDTSLPLTVNKAYKRDKRMLLILVLLLVITNLATVVLLIRASWTNWRWKDSASSFAKYAGALQAMDDFEAGRYRLYQLIEDRDSEFTGRYEGPFEIWYKPYYPILGWPDKYCAKMFIKIYNSKMRYMHEHPEKFKPHPDPTVGDK